MIELNKYESILVKLIKNHFNSKDLLKSLRLFHSIRCGYSLYDFSNSNYYGISNNLYNLIIKCSENNSDEIIEKLHYSLSKPTTSSKTNSTIEEVIILYCNIISTMYIKKDNKILIKFVNIDEQKINEILKKEGIGVDNKIIYE